MSDAFVSIPDVIAAAVERGFSLGDKTWANLGQGQPEHGEIAGAPPRLRDVTFVNQDYAYGPVDGLLELRKAIANYYNALYRPRARSLYTAENVSVAAGGRVALHRTIASLPPMALGHSVPDYAAFQALLRAQQPRITTEPLHTIERPLTSEELESEIRQRGLGAVLFSNPCNPTGHVVAGPYLKHYAGVAREHRCRFIIDEFYSHYVFGKVNNEPVSMARYVDDVDRDPIVIIDGLTKNFRYPGLRIGWTVGPRSFIAGVNDIGTAFDGGPCTVAQRAALRILEPRAVLQETGAIRGTFAEKRRFAAEYLNDLGLASDPHATGTFYLWVDISRLPAPLNDAHAFVRTALAHNVITLPGTVFDVRPTDRHPDMPELRRRLRISCGPDRQEIVQGLQRLKNMIERSRL